MVNEFLGLSNIYPFFSQISLVVRIKVLVKTALTKTGVEVTGFCTDYKMGKPEKLYCLIE